MNYYLHWSKSTLHVLSSVYFIAFGVGAILQIMERTTFYESPVLIVIEVEVEGVLCQSLKPGENEDGILGDEM